ncbi:MAG TPA: hypothetical protein VEW46_24665 [Pyrinomonadaceae bacterium]|nr:hypothetical protein [Pyrinomonadaceae bacterium]
MQQRLIQIIGLAVTAVCAVMIVWLYATEPRSFKEVATGAEFAAGTYQVDQEKFTAALALFRREQFRAARDEWNRADPAQGDARTQFYIASPFIGNGFTRISQTEFVRKRSADPARVGEFVFMLECVCARPGLRRFGI